MMNLGVKGWLLLEPNEITTGGLGAICARPRSFRNCDDGRDLVVITWEGTHDKTNANLAAQIVAKFFTHFHAGEDIRYLLVAAESSKNVLVYKFETVVNNAI